jgi:hypothetical protein
MICLWHALHCRGKCDIGGPGRIVFPGENLVNEWTVGGTDLTTILFSSLIQATIEWEVGREVICRWCAMYSVWRKGTSSRYLASTKSFYITCKLWVCLDLSKSWPCPKKRMASRWNLVVVWSNAKVSAAPSPLQLKCTFWPIREWPVGRAGNSGDVQNRTSGSMFFKRKSYAHELPNVINSKYNCALCSHKKLRTIDPTSVSF